MKNFILIILLAISHSIMAQNNTHPIGGKAFGKKGWEINAKLISKLPKEYKGSFQGMDICNGYLLSMQNHGMATLYRFNGKKLDFQGRFPLESYDKNPSTLNHANVASFTNQYLSKDDELPLVYITRCSDITLYHGYSQICFVERINPQKLSSDLVQVIAFEDEDRPEAHTTQWVLDEKKEFLYGYGNSHENPNRHFLVKFKRPPYRGPQDSLIVLRKKDLIENYQFEDSYSEPNWQPIIQGACIRDNLLYLPMGVGKSDKPSYLYIWNLEKRCMEEEINLQSILPVELEDCTFFGKKLIVQAQKNLYEFTIKQR